MLHFQTVSLDLIALFTVPLDAQFRDSVLLLTAEISRLKRPKSLSIR